jgi:cullin 1
MNEALELRISRASAMMGSIPKGGVLDLEKGWEVIFRDGIKRLHVVLENSFVKDGPTFVHQEYLLVQNMVYHMCTQRAPHNFSEDLYERHAKANAEYMSSTVIGSLRNLSDVDLLKELARHWSNQIMMNKWMFKFFFYVDRFYVEHHNLPLLDEQGMRCFKECVFDAVKIDVTKALFNQINTERDGSAIDRPLLTKCIEVYVRVGPGPAKSQNLDVYEADFQVPLLRMTEAYYERKAAEWLLSSDIPKYLKKVEEELVKESHRVSECMDASTEAPLLKVVESVLLAKRLSSILENEGSGVKIMLRDDKRDDLARLYRLYNRVDSKEGLVPIAAAVKDHFQLLGSNIVKDRQVKTSAAAAAGEDAGKGEKDSVDNPAFVRALLDLHDKARSLVKDQFDGSSLFQKALKDAFENFVNKEVDKEISKHSNVELIVAYTDRILRSGGGLSEDEVEKECERVVSLFQFIHDKDVFNSSYKSMLAKRLLNQRSASEDQERSVISKLKLKQGAQFTRAMEGMMNDLANETMRTNQLEFQQWARAKGLAVSNDFSVQVLMNGQWPSFPPVPELKYPASVLAWQEQYMEFYKEKKKILKFQPSVGTITMSAKFNSGTFELIVTTLQAVALNVFNHLGADGPSSAISFSTIRAEMGMADSPESTRIVKIVLHSLACGKFEILSKIPKNNKIEVDEVFHVNLNFSDKLKKLRIQMASLESKAKESGEVNEGRDQVIQAAAVRIMKSRKQLSHNILMQEIMMQVHTFKPTSKLIKKAIEDLIEREYLERDDSISGYKYLA